MIAKAGWVRKFNQKIRYEIIAAVARLEREEIARIHVELLTRESRYATPEEVDLLLGGIDNFEVLIDKLHDLFPS